MWAVTPNVPSFQIIPKINTFIGEKQDPLSINVFF